MAAAFKAALAAALQKREIVEHAPLWDGVSFLSAIAELRDLGADIALEARMMFTA